jgi:hypothetical protein
MQLWISFILLETPYIPLLYFYSDGSWLRYTYMLMQEFRDAIETVIILLYINVVLMVKQRYQIVTHIFSEAATIDDAKSSSHVDVEHLSSETKN